MNWEAIGAVAELAGAIGVVVSLLYLAVQIRQNTKTVQAQTLQSVSNAAQDWLRIPAEDTDRARVFRIGTLKPEELNEDELAQYFVFLSGMFRGMENQFLQLQRGTLDSVDWDSHVVLAQRQIATPGVQLWWKSQAEAYNPQFRQFIDSLRRPPAVQQAVGRRESPEERNGEPRP